MQDSMAVIVLIAEAIVMSALSGFPYKTGFIANKRGLFVIPYAIIMPAFLVDILFFSEGLTNYYLSLFFVILLMHLFIRKNVCKRR